MFYLALIGLLAILILLLVNYDILFQQGSNQNIPAVKIYRRFLYAVLISASVAFSETPSTS